MYEQGMMCQSAITGYNGGFGCYALVSEWHAPRALQLVSVVVGYHTFLASEWHREYASHGIQHRKKISCCFASYACIMYQEVYF
jgi:hypothetical protein